VPSTIIRRRARLASLVPVAAAAAAASDLDITELVTFPIVEPTSRRSYTIVRLKTRSGIYGYGECRGTPSTEQLQVARQIYGRPASSYEVIAQRLNGAGDLAAAINMALLDLLGKAVRAPVYQLLGGPTRFKARALAPLAGDTDQELAASMERAAAAGFRAFLVPAPAPPERNQGQAWVLAVRRRMEALRKIGGAEADFVLDGRGILTPSDAASLASALERFHLMWFDEPCLTANLSAVRKISEENVTPIGFGRNVTEASFIQDLLRENAVDVIRPDISKLGIVAIRRMAALAETYYVAVAPYHDGGPIATAAALHLAASLPNFFIQQVPWPASEQDRRLREALVSSTVERATGGFLPLPKGPGFGIAVDEKALEKYSGGVA